MHEQMAYLSEYGYVSSGRPSGTCLPVLGTGVVYGTVCLVADPQVHAYLSEVLGQYGYV